MKLKDKIKQEWIHLTNLGKFLVILIAFLIVLFILWLLEKLLSFYLNNVVFVVAVVSIAIILIACAFKFFKGK